MLDLGLALEKSVFKPIKVTRGYRVRNQVSSKILLKYFMAVSQAGGPILQLLCRQARSKIKYSLNF